MKTIIKKTALMFILSLFFVPQSLANSTINVKVNDTIAGYATVLKTSYTEPDKEVIFRITKPDNSVVEIQAMTNEIGVAEVDFTSFHTRKSGQYEVVAFLANESDYNAPVSTFEVFSGDLSHTTSSVYVDPPSISADGVEKALIKVSLRDKYNNPVEKHNLMLVSSRPGDEIIEVDNKKADKNGNVYFQISSKEAGISYITVLDQITGQVLEDREKIVFYEPDNNYGQGGNWFEANIFGGIDSDEGNGDISANITDSDELFGPIDHFEIDFPNKVEVGSDQNFLTIIAKDSDGNVVKSYTGTIIISTPNDENAILPGDGRYTYQARDQGERTFDLALIFSKSGRQMIEVYDFDPDTGEISELIKGEKIVEVTDETTGPVTNPDPSTELVIKKPADGSRSNSSTVVVVGKGRANTNLKIFIDDVKVADVEVDADGLFTKEVKNVSDGHHLIFVKEAEGSQESSASIDFEVDTTPPSLDELIIKPEGGIEVDQVFDIEVYSSPDLPKVEFQAGAVRETLIEDETEKGKYTLRIPAPADPGEYPITITLVDDLQNTGKYTNSGILSVLPAENKTPITIIGFEVAEIGEDRVKLSWERIENLTENALQLQLSYGTNKFYLKDTKTIALDLTETEVKSLDVDTNYFFMLSVLDSFGETLSESGIINAKTTDDGLITNPEPLHPSANELVATPGNGQVFLRWTNTSPSFYELKVNINNTPYFETLNFSGTTSSANITNLINGQKYVFTIKAKDSTGSYLDTEYPIATATPEWDGTAPQNNNPIIQNYNPPQNQDTGPLSEKIIFSSILIIIAGFLFRKAFLIYKN